MEAYKETQELRKSIWTIVFIAFAFCAAIPVLIGIIQGNKDALELWPVFVVIAFIVALFLLIKLKTQIDETGVSVQYGFFQRHQKKYHWNDIAKVQVRKYNPLFEYGGWGYKKSIFFKKRAYSVTGNLGLELTLLDGSDIMIGTKNEEEIKAYLLYLKGKYQIKALMESVI